MGWVGEQPNLTLSLTPTLTHAPKAPPLQLDTLTGGMCKVVCARYMYMYMCTLMYYMYM